MKKFFLVFVGLFVLLLSACGNNCPVGTPNTYNPSCPNYTPYGNGYTTGYYQPGYNTGSYPYYGGGSYYGGTGYYGGAYCQPGMPCPYREQQ